MITVVIELMQVLERGVRKVKVKIGKLESNVIIVTSADTSRMNAFLLLQLQMDLRQQLPTLLPLQSRNQMKNQQKVQARARVKVMVKRESTDGTDCRGITI